MSTKRVFSPAQCRAARGLLAWSQDQLADAAGLKLEAVQLYEAAEGELRRKDRRALAAALEAAGVVPIEPARAGEGVRFRRGLALPPARLPSAGPAAFDRRRLPLAGARA